MHARTFVTLALVACVPKVQADARLSGVVLQNEVSGPPMANVQVSAVAGNTNNTDANGKFTFRFPKRDPGDTVRLIIRKEGYVVVNDIQLELTLPSHPEERPAMFLMCKPADREEMARRYYRVAIAKAIDRAYQKKLSNYAGAGQGRVRELLRERDQVKRFGERVAERAASEKPGAGREGSRQTTRLFLDGKVDQATVMADQ